MNISAVIPLYNKVSTIERAIASVMGQSVLPMELVIVDDGSTDGSAQHVLSLGETPVPIRLIRQENQGVSSARNRGIAEAQGEWIALLDADDQWEPGFLEEILRLSLQHPEAHLCATAYGHTDQQGRSQGLTLNRLPFVGERGLLTNYFEVAAHSNPPFCSISVCVRKESIQAISGFPLGIIAGEDLLTWARLALLGPIAYSTRPLATFFPQRESYYSRPSREPQEGDPVGKALAQMLSEHPETLGLKEYLAHWHKMRASIYLRLPQRTRLARNEIEQARRLDPTLSPKLRLYLFLALLPYRLRMAIFSALG